MTLWAGPDRPGCPPAATRRWVSHYVVPPCPDRYTGWSFAWRALVFFVLFALPAGLVVVSLVWHALNAMRGWQ